MVEAFHLKLLAEIFDCHTSIVKEFFQDRVVPLIIGIDHTVLPKVYFLPIIADCLQKDREDILLIRVFFVPNGISMR